MEPLKWSGNLQKQNAWHANEIQTTRTWYNNIYKIPIRVYNLNRAEILIFVLLVHISWHKTFVMYLYTWLSHVYLDRQYKLNNKL